jgi:hypothetical protein
VVGQSPDTAQKNQATRTNSTLNKTTNVYSKSSKKKVRSAVENLYATNPNDLIPGRNRDGAIFTYLGASHYVLNLSVKQAFAKLGEDDTAEALVAELLQMGDKGVWATKSREEMKELYRLGKVKNVLPCSIFLYRYRIFGNLWNGVS